jgi:Ser/Thr protein kinase RdoA (MazF antagonist)
MLPHRDVLLDPSAMIARFARALGDLSPARIEACECLRVDYQAGESVRALYALGVDGQRQFVAARMFREGHGAIQANGVARDASIDTIFWPFPDDRRLRGLSAIAATPVPGEMTQFVPFEWATSRLVAYAPETSATAACLDRSGQTRAFVKLCADDQAAREHGHYEAIRASLDPGDPALYVPRPLASSTPHRLLWIEALDGRSLVGGAGLDGSQPDHQQDAWEQRSLWRLGAALARFHDCALPNAPVFTRFDDEHLVLGAQTLARLRPDIEDEVFELVSELIARRVWIDNDNACLHGDVDPSNILITDDVVALIDLGDVAIGPSAADVGSFLANLAAQYVAGQTSRSAYVGRGEAVIAGYESRGRCLPRSLTWHMAAALFIEHAVRAVTRVRPHGLTHLRALIAHAQDLMEGKTAFSTPQASRRLWRQSAAPATH